MRPAQPMRWGEWRAEEKPQRELARPIRTEKAEKEPPGGARKPECGSGG